MDAAEMMRNCNLLLRDLAIQLRPVDKFRWRMNMETWQTLIKSFSMEDNAAPEAERKYMGLPLDLDESFGDGKIVLRWEEEVK